ncbi:hypothetical protein AT251_21895 [Enterovibrio nigricans]|uniref:Holin n=2 Tax=Enterovibrio nigricans TaxID=504469 RepID=A0A1T4W185_9GAMM|nr:hypothetical protein [Enterovibrio nigricans]PKF49024.1 hypothetical protein AT251_21895 [Enterovibrio nigricans]SKA71010.1 hypothetical protein SAMN02745132_04648 [Enterovibrio nigricans DSM 22720]
MKYVNTLLKQPSTYKGLALLGSMAAVATGNGHLFTAEMTNTGMVYGGMIGTLVPTVLGLWETLRNEHTGE